MTKYYFNTELSGRTTVDVFGLDLKDDGAAREVACRIARRMADLPHDPSECFVYVTTDSGCLAFRVAIGDRDLEAYRESPQPRASERWRGQ